MILIVSWMKTLVVIVIIYITDEHTTLYGITLWRPNETLTVTGKYYTTY